MMLSNGKVAKMPDKKLTDNEIIKALETCCGDNGCFGCPYTENHSCRLLRNPIKDALDLINRLQRENKNYSQNNQTMTKDILELQKENARLKPFEDKFAEFNVHIRVEDMLVCASSLGEWLEFCDNLKAEAYNEFAEWLYSLFPTPNSEIVVISRTGIAKKVNELLDKRSD